MKIAIVHDWLVSYRGGERVLNAISSLFPQAPIYTLVYSKTKVPESISKKIFKASFLQKIPGIERFYRNFLPIFPVASETLLDKKYDLIISVSSAVAKSVNTRGAKHWCYINSPMRYIWDRFDDYFGPKRVGHLASNLFFKPLSWYLQKYDVYTSKRVNNFVCNSDFVRNRVLKYYKREAEVIYPPVDIDKFSLSTNNKEYYLFLSALVCYKKADHAILACNKLKKKLVVAGNGPELNHLKRIADSRYITFINNVSDDQIQNVYSKAKALIFPGIEDFGIVPVEANAVGIPVIGLNIGGLSETQTNDTCQFYNNQTVDSLANSILEFEAKSFDPQKIRENSYRFSISNFNSKITESINKLMI